MENNFGPLMAAKSDSELLHIVEQKHRYQPEAFLAAIEELERRHLATPELLQEKSNVLEAIRQNNAAANKPGTREAWKGTLELFKVTREYFYTPVIIYLNISIWIIMIATGVNAFEPSVESLINWGGNLSVLTWNGQPWRLFTSTFLHGGIFHLLLNMYALLQVGAIIETSFGKHRYALVYIVTGILASTASAAFSVNIVSVGASGAIFGLYGLFLSLLLTKSLHLTNEERTNFLYSTLTFIGYNVAFGFAKEGIDNAAHIGGLLSGFAIGFLYYPATGKPRLSTIISASLVVLVVLSTWAMPNFVSNKYGEFQVAMETFSKAEEKALWFYDEELPAPGTKKAKRFRKRLETEGIDLWTANLTTLNNLHDMPDPLQERINLLKNYCTLRIESCKAMQILTLDTTNIDEANHLNEINSKISATIDSLKALN